MDTKLFILLIIVTLVLSASYIAINRTHTVIEPVTPESSFRYIHETDRITGKTRSYYCIVFGKETDPKSSCKRVFRSR